VIADAGLAIDLGSEEDPASVEFMTDFIGIHVTPICDRIAGP
jgi:hypothetical protein